jgi:hypothetical protein
MILYLHAKELDKGFVRAPSRGRDFWEPSLKGAQGNPNPDLERNQLRLTTQETERLRLQQRLCSPSLQFPKSMLEPGNGFIVDAPLKVAIIPIGGA